MTKYLYSVLKKSKKGTRFIGMYWNLKYAKQNAKLEKGKVIRFKCKPDGSCVVQGEGCNSVVLRGKLN